MFPMIQHMSGHLIFSTITLYHYNVPLITKHLSKSTRLTHHINFRNLLLTFFHSFKENISPSRACCFLISCQLIVLSFYCAPCCRAVGYVVSSQSHTGVTDHLSVHLKPCSWKEPLGLYKEIPTLCIKRNSISHLITNRSLSHERQEVHFRVYIKTIANDMLASISSLLICI